MCGFYRVRELGRCDRFREFLHDVLDAALDLLVYVVNFFLNIDIIIRLLIANIRGKAVCICLDTETDELFYVVDDDVFSLYFPDTVQAICNQRIGKKKYVVRYEGPVLVEKKVY